MAAFCLRIEPLTTASFAPFGDVISTEGRQPIVTNQGTAERFDDLARLDLTENGGRPLLSIFRAQPVRPPVRLRLVERHPIASQAFFPLSSVPFLVVVAAGGAAPAPEALRAFVTDGHQGVNLHRGVWHHPLLALERTSEFLVVDRGDEVGNYDEVSLEAREVVIERVDISGASRTTPD